ncbi:tRNA lysidine(34) synthetase TilS [Sphingosinicella sp. BN140058]|uniref:tRNA lysidine(34) synthetase TilS n=1 Tax=Sphingosinicella sp. BN140058 TaxID=1892855 RepID=UPI00101050A0|nr:tRNA lysidine(34) synthetase TilS [Sphingosinicella sp. BN140058]QAY75684.1 tRNA lysidine(34) synthetase TilS [Sphingosinicella sp. BN140058]
MAFTAPDPLLVERFRHDLHAAAGGVPRRIGVAVSGGPDSLALLLLASAAAPAAVAAATVDHRLRPESAEEAATVARICAGIGVPHHILAVEVPRGASVQARAREARYAALRHWAETEQLPVIVTGHHADDQAETLMMRLLRGSGVAGLAGIRARTTLGPSALLCRPLLGWRRHELAAIVAAAGGDAVDDPSNRDERFDRARMRRRLSEAQWIDPLALSRSAAALAEADETLDAVAEGLAAERLSTGEGWALLAPAGVPALLLRRLVTRALVHVAPDAAPRGDQLGGLLDRLGKGETCNLAGALCRGGEHWRFEPEPRRRV